MRFKKSDTIEQPFTVGSGCHFYFSDAPAIISKDEGGESGVVIGNNNEKFNREMSGSKRRSRLCLGVNFFIGSSEKILDRVNLGIIEMVSPNTEFLGSGAIPDKNVWKLLRRSKQLLSMRTVTPQLIQKLDLRRDWNLIRPTDTVLDLFPSLKYSYSSLCGRKFDGEVKIIGNGKKVRISDIARSHSIRLDPVDSPKELFKYRQRIQKIIGWAYSNNLVPVMMTLTLFHRWHYLAPLIRVLGGAWSDLFSGSAGLKRKEHIGLAGYVRRMEETFNDADDDFGESFNSGWHPHYHVILLVPRDKLQTVSDYESELRKVWVSLVCKHYVKEFGEEIPASYLQSFEEHGLVFSRYESAQHAKHCGCRHGKAGDLFEVKDGKYLAKIMGTDSPLYGGDSELTASLLKMSKTPFDLLRGEVTANVADLWCEYAIATKKIPCFTFSHGLQKKVDAYFESSDLVGDSSLTLPLEAEGFVIRLKDEDYRWLYRHFQIENLLEVAKNSGYEGVKAWLKDSFDMEVIEDIVGDDIAVSGESVVDDCANVESTGTVDAVDVGAVSAQSDVVVGSYTLPQTFSINADVCAFDEDVDITVDGVSSLKRYDVFKPIGSVCNAEVAITFPRIETLWCSDLPANRARAVNCLIIPRKDSIIPCYSLDYCNNKSPPFLFGRNKSPPAIRKEAGI